MWVTSEGEDDIQVLPVGEEDYHRWDNMCSCCPRVNLSEEGKMIVLHNSFDGREILEEAYETPLHRVRQQFDC